MAHLNPRLTDRNMAVNKEAHVCGATEDDRKVNLGANRKLKWPGPGTLCRPHVGWSLRFMEPKVTRQPQNQLNKIYQISTDVR